MAVVIMMGAKEEVGDVVCSTTKSILGAGWADLLVNRTQEFDKEDHCFFLM